MRSYAWIGNSRPCIMCNSMLPTISSMSDWCGICFLMTDRGVSVGMSAWGICVYSISGGLMVLTGCISKSGCFSVVKLSVLVLIAVCVLLKVNTFQSFDQIYSPVYSH